MPELYTSSHGVANASQSTDMISPSAAFAGIEYLLDKKLKYQQKLLEAQRNTVKIEAQSRARVYAAQVFQEASKLDDPSAVVPYVTQKIGEHAQREIGSIGDDEVKRDLTDYFNDFGASATISAMKMESGKTSDRLSASILTTVNQDIVDSGNDLEDEQTFNDRLSNIEQTIRKGTGTAYDETKTAEMIQSAKRGAFMSRFNALKDADPLFAAKVMRERGGEFGLDVSDARQLEAQATHADAQRTAGMLDDLSDQLNVAANNADVGSFMALAATAPDTPDFQSVISERKHELQQRVHAQNFNYLNNEIMLGHIELEQATDAIKKNMEIKPDDPYHMDASDVQQLNKNYHDLIEEREKLSDATFRFDTGRPMEKTQQKYFDKLVRDKTIPKIRIDLGPKASQDQIDLEAISRTWRSGLVPSYLADEVNSSTTNPSKLKRAAGIHDAYIAHGGALAWDNGFDPRTRSYVEYYSRMTAVGVPDQQAAQRITDIVFNTKPGMKENLALRGDSDRKKAQDYWNTQGPISDSGGYEKIDQDVQNLLMDGYLLERQATGDAELAHIHAWEAIKNNVRLSEVFTDKKQLKVNPVEMFANGSYTPQDIKDEFAKKLVSSLEEGATLNLPEGVSLPENKPMEVKLFFPGPIPAQTMVSTPEQTRKLYVQQIGDWANENVRLVAHPSKTVLDDNGIRKPIYKAIYQDKLGRIFDLTMETTVNKVKLPTNPDGLIKKGNVDLSNRPRVVNSDGSVSTVRSMSVNFDGQEVLIPTVSDDGKILSDDDAIDLYKKTGKHLGIFDTPENATRYAEMLHKQQESLISERQIVPVEFDARYRNSEKKSLDTNAMKEANERKARMYKYFRDNFSTSFSTSMSTSSGGFWTKEQEQQIQAGERIMGEGIKKAMTRALIGPAQE